jgi:hypothetical protein
MATQADLENAVRKVLNEGTAQGATSWAATNKGIMTNTQNLINMVGSVKADMATSSKQDLILFGDGRDVPPGSDTHPWNLKVVRQYCLDILAALDDDQAADPGR